MTSDFDKADAQLRDRFRTRLPDQVMSAEASVRLHATMRRATADLKPQPRETPAHGWLWRWLLGAPDGGLAPLAIGMTAAGLALCVAVSWLLSPPPGAPAQAVALAQGGAVVVTRHDSGSVNRLLDRATTRLEAGDEIDAQSGSVVISYFSGQSTTLMPGARARLLSLSRDDGGTQVELRIEQGRSVSQVDRRLGAADRFSISSPNVATTVKGTEFVLESQPDGGTLVATLRGVVSVRQGDDQVDVPAGQQVQAVPGKPMQVESQLQTSWLAPFYRWFKDLFHIP